MFDVLLARIRARTRVVAAERNSEMRFAELQPAVDNVLRDEKFVAVSIDNFRSIVASIKLFHAAAFQQFTKHVVIA